MTENYANAVAAIENADLSAPIYRTARRLLDLAADHDGQVELTPAALQELCGGAAEGTMRAHLIQLTLWGILAYNMSLKHGRIVVRFTAYPMPIVEEWPSDVFAQRTKARAAPTFLITGRAETAEASNGVTEVVIVGRSNSRAGRAEMIAGRSEPTEPVSNRALDDQNRALDDQNRALDDQNRALDDQKGGRGVGWLVDIDPPPLKNDLTNQPTRLNGTSASPPAAATPSPIDPLEQARSVALLLAAGVMPRNAKRLAAEHPFERTQRVVGYWWDGKQDGKFQDNPGLVVRLLDDWEAAGVPVELPRAFLASALYRRHRTPAQIAAEETLRAQSVVRTGLEPDATPPPAAPPAETDPLATLWTQTLACYQEHTRLLLSETRLTAINADQAIISGPHRLETIFSRMAWKILKDLRFAGLAVTTVVFQPQEVTHA